MSLTIAPQRSASDEDVNEYATKGHTGYILAYRDRHHGEDPAPEELAQLAKRAERLRCGFLARMLKGLIDALT
jgi:hypothetical protein